MSGIHNSRPSPRTPAEGVTLQGGFIRKVLSVKRRPCSHTALRPAVNNIELLTALFGLHICAAVHWGAAKPVQVTFRRVH